MSVQPGSGAGLLGNGMDSSVDVLALEPFGARISGLDLARPIGAKRAEFLRALLFSHQFLVFRNQAMSPSQQVRFSHCF